MKKLWGLIRNSPATCITHLTGSRGSKIPRPHLTYPTYLYLTYLIEISMQKWAIFRGCMREDFWAMGIGVLVLHITSRFWVYVWYYYTIWRMAFFFCGSVFCGLWYVPRGKGEIFRA